MSRASITLSLENQEALIKQIREIAGPNLPNVAARAVKIAMQPTIDMAKENVPKFSGRLEGSLGQQAARRGGPGWVASRVGMRRDFSFTSMDNQKMYTGNGRKRAKALAGGAKQDTGSPLFYGRLIEFGHDQFGHMRRKAGPADYLEKAILADQSFAISTVADELRRYIETTK